MSKQGVTAVEFSGREIHELRFLVSARLGTMKHPKTMLDKQGKAALNGVLRKLYGEYRCKHCKQWVNKEVK